MTWLKSQSWYQRLRLSEPVILGITAVITGLCTGIGIWLFKSLIELVEWISFDWLSGLLVSFGPGHVVVIPVLGGLLVGLVTYFFVKHERHHGVAGIMEAVALAGGRLRYWRMPAKAVAAAVSIGSGASVGPEDPSVQIGANIGSLLGQRLHMSDERTRTLAAAGVAGGIPAAFNAPIAGVFFALEIILGEISGNAFSMVVIASVVSSVFTQAVSGSAPAFQVPAYIFKSAWELPLYLGLGLLAGPLAAVYIRLVYALQDIFRKLKLPRWLKPAIAGLIVGFVGIWLPQVFGVGYDTIEAILNGASGTFWLLLTLLVTKLLLTPTSLAGGFMGGVFAPALFLGATLGGAYGTLVEGLFPNLNIQPPAFAMVGMAAVLAGAVHAPLTAILLLFEMTHDYRIILPLMFAVAISLLVSQRIQRDSVYAHGLALRGIRLDRGRDIDILETMTVQEVMQTDNTAIPENASLAEAAEIMSRMHRQGLPVCDLRGDLCGILTIQDLERGQSREPKPANIGAICTRNPQVAYPDETIGAALRRMSQWDVGRLPVVAHENPKQLAGLLRRSDVVHAYNIALSRRSALRHRAHQVHLDAITPEMVDVIEVSVQPGSRCDGRQVKDIAWPRESMIATLRRGRQVSIPRGTTVIRAGDLLVVVAEAAVQEEIKLLCKQ